ncbi:Abi family protein [Candidatus Poriferisocius sp.]|uniref:Abi family protein n=1 Tax=Candidatus Poriferisocius sp. TaxID=3101276 RepID=UPI003B02B6B0
MADQPYNYSVSAVSGLVSSVSSTRFDTYRQGVDTDAAALQLYTWNTAAAAAFYGPLQTLEIVLRNAVHDAMSKAHGTRWFENPLLLRPAEQGKTDEAIQHLNDLHKRPTPGRIVAALPFGFWVTLFANAYDTTIWRTDLHNIFAPRVKDRGGLHDTLDRLRTLRNRIAHHEPIFQRSLKDDYQRIRIVIGLLSRPTLDWQDHHSRVPDILNIKPDAVQKF